MLLSRDVISGHDLAVVTCCGSKDRGNRPRRGREVYIMSSTDHGPDKDSAPTRNSAEREAYNDYINEAANTEKDPIPRERPEWAKDLPEPKEKGGNKRK